MKSIDGVTIGCLFCDTYLLIENNRWGYIILKHGDKVPYVRMSNPNLKDKIKIHNIDDLPFVVLHCRPKFIKSIIRVRTEPRRIYHLLKFYFADDDIKDFWYDLWLFNHNEVAKKNIATELSNYNRFKKLGQLKKVDGEIVRITKHPSIRQAAKWSII